MVYKTRDESLKAYKEYVDDHIHCVQRAGEIYGDIIFDLVQKRFSGGSSNTKLSRTIFKEQLISVLRDHDRSKYGMFEFNQYAANFYPCERDLKNPEKVKAEFDKAWKHHYSMNRHHPEAWIYTMDGETRISSMTNISFAEMICDWIGFSINKKSSVLDWWDNYGGSKEKKELLPENDFKIIDEFIRANSDRFDFSKV